MTRLNSVELTDTSTGAVLGRLTNSSSGYVIEIFTDLTFAEEITAGLVQKAFEQQGS